MENSDDTYAWLRMSDLTVPSNPDEVWQVDRDKFPIRPLSGQYVRFHVTEKGESYFKLEPLRPYTSYELERAKERAARYLEIWGSQ